MLLLALLFAILTEHLTPPPLNTEDIFQKIVCVRPYRHGGLQISRQLLHDKTVLHCYGHGALGLSMLFGSVEETIGLAHFEKSTPIRVLGGGCIGLLAAIELKRRGYTVCGITAESVTHTTSCHAGGLFGFTKEQEKIGLFSYALYSQIAEGRHPYISKSCVRLLPCYCSENASKGFQEMEKRGMTPPHENVTLDFGNGVRHEGFHKYLGLFIETEQLVEELLQEVARLEIPIEIKKVNSFFDVQEPVIVNCTGLGSLELNHDVNVEPVVGHLITLSPYTSKDHMDYMISCKVMQEGKEEFLYLFPKSLCDGMKCHGVLGGTFIREKNETTDRQEFKKLIERHREFFFPH